MSDNTTKHHIEASDGRKSAVVGLLKAHVTYAEGLSNDKRYDVEILIEES